MAILLDTGFLYAFHNIKDKNHVLASESYKKLLKGEYGIPFLLDYVFDELVTLIQFRTKRTDLATNIGRLLLKDTEKYLNFIQTSKSNFDQGWDLFQDQSGTKYLSFTDCILIKYSETNRINKIASLDNQFKSWVEVIP